MVSCIGHSCEAYSREGEKRECIFPVIPDICNREFISLVIPASVYRESISLVIPDIVYRESILDFWGWIPANHWRG